MLAPLNVCVPLPVLITEIAELLALVITPAKLPLATPLICSVLVRASEETTVFAPPESN